MNVFARVANIRFWIRQAKAGRNCDGGYLVLKKNVSLPIPLLNSTLQAMLNMPSLSLVIPCYNEVERLHAMAQGISEFIAQWHSPFEIIVIDDGSTDDTLVQIKAIEVCSNLIADNKLKLLSQPHCGKGAAIKCGVAAASMQYILTLDADMATHPAEVMLWARAKAAIFANENLITIASRVLPQSELVLISNRRSNGKLFNKIVRMITGLQQRDTQCGFKLYPSAIGKKLFGELRTNGWAHDVEILLRAKKEKIAVQEMPITWNEKSASKIHVLRDGAKMLLEVLRIKWIVK